MFYLIISKNIQGVWMCRQPKKTLVGTTDRVNFTEEESACNAGDPGLIPGSERSSREGIGCPLQYSWASLMVQIVKNLPARRETWVWSLGWEDPLEEGMATHSSILAWRIPMDKGAWWATVHGVTKSLSDWVIKHKYTRVIFGLESELNKNKL